MLRRRGTPLRCCRSPAAGRACLGAFLVLLMGAAAWGADSLSEDRASLYQGYATRLGRLATWCDGEHLTEQALLVRGWLPKRDPAKRVLFVVDERASAETEALSSKTAAWHKRFRALRKTEAAALFALARRAAQARRPSLALELVHEVLREDPDHGEARRILGYEKAGGGWVTPYAKRMQASGYVWHARFGWLKKEDIARYEAGERRQGRRWWDADEDAERHRSIERGWQIKTAHYLVTTNHSLEEGVRMAERLERLRQVWRQLFAGYYLKEGELARVFAGERKLRSRSTPHQVLLYRSRDEYNRALRPAQPRIDITLGIYLDRNRRAYFFSGEDQSVGTLNHEATHQLFHETRKVTAHVGEMNNFWIVEGIATYLESLTESRDSSAGVYYTLGGDDVGRLPAARHRLLEDQFYVPLEELTQMGMADLQGHPEIAKLYSQTAGLATFLMHGEGGRYRQAVVRYLVDVYRGKASDQTLAELTGRSFDQLDREYRRFLQNAAPTTKNPGGRYGTDAVGDSAR